MSENYSSGAFFVSETSRQLAVSLRR
jgi:hypothetical protein